LDAADDVESLAAELTLSAEPALALPERDSEPDDEEGAAAGGGGAKSLGEVGGGIVIGGGATR